MSKIIIYHGLKDIIIIIVVKLIMIMVLVLFNTILLFTGCSESSHDKTSNDRYQTYITLKVVCIEGLEAYRGYSGYPAMYKRDINDKLIPCDNNKFNN